MKQDPPGLGRYPLDIDIKVRTISFWAKLISGKQTKLSAIIYKCMYMIADQILTTGTCIANINII